MYIISEFFVALRDDILLILFVAQRDELLFIFYPVYSSYNFCQSLNGILFKT